MVCMMPDERCWQLPAPIKRSATEHGADNPPYFGWSRVIYHFVYTGTRLHGDRPTGAEVNASAHSRPLNIGAPADVAVVEFRNGMFEFIDNYNNTRNGPQRLFPVATVLGGNRSPPRA